MMLRTPSWRMCFRGFSLPIAPTLTGIWGLTCQGRGGYAKCKIFGYLSPRVSIGRHLEEPGKSGAKAGPSTDAKSLNWAHLVSVGATHRYRTGHRINPRLCFVGAKTCPRTWPGLTKASLDCTATVGATKAVAASPRTLLQNSGCCAQQTGMHRMNGSNCLIPCRIYVQRVTCTQHYSKQP